MSRHIGHLFAILATVALLAVPITAYAAELGLPACTPLAPRFCADASYFLRNGSYVLEVYFVICNESLQFIRTDRGYRAKADVSVILRDRKNRQVAGDTYWIRLSSPDYRGTTALDSCETRAIAFKAEPGEFRMALTVTDADSRARSPLEARIKIPRLDSTPGLSDVTMLLPDGASANPRWDGYRPSVQRVYTDAESDIAYYYEVYGPETGDSITVREQIADRDGIVLFETASTVWVAIAASYISGLPVDSLSNGQYLLKVSVLGPDGQALVTRPKEFGIKTEAFYFGKDVSEAEALLTYIASGSLIDSFVKADSEKRRRIWEQFWREKDPTPETPRNEFYEEHLRRFRFANANFGTHIGAGWRTDRGRIYIIYGEPDEIESYPLEVSRNPVEVWHYFDKGRRFVFVDETGFGDYVLTEE